MPPTGGTATGCWTCRSESLVGAPTLYLDFINIFLFLLRILGGRRRD
jgi:FtsH-binding integral membrane protein